VNHQLRDDEERHRHQEAGMDVHVSQEGYRHAPAWRLAFQGREQQERQPREERDPDRAPAHQLQRVAGQVRSTQKLIEGPARDQREVPPIAKQIFAGERLGRCHVGSPDPQILGLGPIPALRGAV
jgi:hypothetical protein